MFLLVGGQVIYLSNLGGLSHLAGNSASLCHQGGHALAPVVKDTTLLESIVRAGVSPTRVLTGCINSMVTQK